MIGKIMGFVAVVALMVATGCMRSESEEDFAGRNAVNDLTKGIMSLGPGIDPEEAARAARIAISYAQQLKVEYGVTDPPIIHNIKVNSGLRPRGLCWHWAEDMEKRLKLEDFKTLELHRAIANASHPIRIEHSTAIISRRGDTMPEGMVLDPWRFGGTLFFSPVLEDPSYVWEPRAEVLAAKQEQRRREERLQAAGIGAGN